MKSIARLLHVDPSLLERTITFKEGRLINQDVTSPSTIVVSYDAVVIFGLVLRMVVCQVPRDPTECINVCDVLAQKTYLAIVETV